MSKHWTTVCMAIVVGFVVVAGWLTWSISSSDDEAKSEPVSTSAAVDDGEQVSGAEVSEASSDETDCDVAREGASTELPVVTPETEWELWRGLVVASSEEHGPFEFSENGDVSSCFARTPIGAVIAAHDLGMRVALPSEVEGSVKAMTMPGPGQDRLIKILVERGVIESVQGMEGLCRSAGFVVIDYTADRATIEHASTCSSGTIKATTSVVAWDGDDWKLVLADDGESAHTQHQIFSLDTYIEWKAI